MKLILLTLFAALSTAHAATVCEGNASKNWPQSLVNLIEKALDRQILEPSDLEGILSGQTWSNPVTRKQRSLDNVALSKGIAQALARVNGEDRERVRTALAEVVKKKLESQNQIDGAREETQTVIDPVNLDLFGPEWPADYRRERKTVAGKFAGRPVFLAVFSKNVMLIDPFHSDFKKRMRRLTSLDSDQGPSDYGFIERDGRTYAQVLEAKFTYGLEAEKEVQLELDETLKFKKVIVEGREFLISVFDKKTLVVRQEGQPDWSFEDPKGHEVRDPTIFALDGKLYVGFSQSKRSDDGEQDMGHLFRVEMKTRDVAKSQEFEFWQPTFHRAFADEHLSLVVAQQVFRFDWRTMNAEILFECFGTVMPFLWQGRYFVFMGLKIIDLETLMSAAEFKWSTSDVEIFEYSGQLYALHSEWKKKPWVMQLTQPTPR